MELVHTYIGIGLPFFLWLPLGSQIDKSQTTVQEHFLQLDNMETKLRKPALSERERLELIEDIVRDANKNIDSVAKQLRSLGNKNTNSSDNISRRDIVVFLFVVCQAIFFYAAMKMVGG